MTELIAGYGRAVQQLRGVSRGRYPGPAVTETVLDHAFTSIAGLDTDALRASARLAAGNADTTGVQGWLGPLLKFFGSVGAGLVVSEVIEKVEDWVTNRGEATEVADAADRAADAIDTTVLESDGGIEAILVQLAEIIGQISSHLATIDPEKHPELFMTTLQAGVDIIDDAAAMVLGLCADRDRAIEDCYCALIDHGNRVCGQPDPVLAPAVSAPQARGAAGSGVGGDAGGSGGISAGTGTPPVTSKETPTVASPVTTPASVPPVEGGAGDDLGPVDKSGEDASGDCSEHTEKEQPDCAPDVTRDQESPCVESPDAETPGAELPGGDDINTGGSGGMLLGAIGAGLLVAGVGLIINFLEQAVHDLVAGVGQEIPGGASEMTTQSPTEAPGQLPVEATSPESAESQDTQSKDIGTEATSTATPEAQLHLVPEPAPKPSPNVVPAAAVENPTPMTPSSESTPAPHQAPAAPAGSAGSAGSAAPGAPAAPAAPVAVAQQISTQPAQPLQPVSSDPAGSPGSPDTQPRLHKAGGW